MAITELGSSYSTFFFCGDASRACDWLAPGTLLWPAAHLAYASFLHIYYAPHLRIPGQNGDVSAELSPTRRLSRDALPWPAAHLVYAFYLHMYAALHRLMPVSRAHGG